MRGRLDPRREDGVAMAELALVTPIFLLLFIGLVSFGQTFYYWLNANHLANETARWAAVDHNPVTGRTLQQQARDNMGNANVCISFQDDNPNDGQPDPPAVGRFVTVKVQKPMTFGINLPMIPALSTGFTVRGTSTQRIESMNDLTAPTAYSTADNIGSCT